jgi:hypothetical protein
MVTNGKREKKAGKLSLRHAVKRKIDALKAEATRLTDALVNEERATSRLQCMQSELAAKLSRAALRKVEIQKGIARVHKEIEEEQAR